MGIFRRFLTGFAVAAFGLSGAALFSGAAMAGMGQPSEWQMGFQQAATPIMEQITSFHAFVTAIILAISIFVMALLAWVIIRFNERRNPVPSRTSHNTPLEVAWTVVPILILVMIAIPSFRLLFAQYDFPKADITLNVTGHQWYWSYEYPDEEISFDSIMVEEAQLQEGQPRLLTVDNEVVVPVNKNVLVQVKSMDVIHDWAVPSFGIKLDAVPGRLQTTWFRAEHTGTFYGQCSELCGRRHAFMPIAIRVVTDEEYADWLTKTKEAALESKSRYAKGEKAGEKSASAEANEASLVPASADESRIASAN